MVRAQGKYCWPFPRFKYWYQLFSRPRKSRTKVQFSPIHIQKARALACIIQCLDSKQICLTCVRFCYVSLLPPKLTDFHPPQAVQQSALIGVNVFKFSLHLSGRFILAVVTTNGYITTGSGHHPWGISPVGGGSPVRTYGETDPPCQPWYYLPSLTDRG